MTIEPMAAPTGAFASAVAALHPADEAAAAAAAARQDRLVKPAGSLGALEALSIRLAALAGRCPPPVPDRPAVAIFAADHGVVAAGVTPWPSEVTRQMVAAACAGVAASSVLARQVGARLVTVDVGVAGDPLPEHPSLWHRRVRSGSDDLSRGPAFTLVEAVAALDAGAACAAQLVAEGADLLVTGEMGIGNTTAAAAVIAALTGRPAAEVTGRGTGIDDTMLTTKTGVVARAVARLAPCADAVDVLAEVGGLEIAALAGFVVGAAAARVPVVLDGVITLAGALTAVRLAPGCAPALIAGHRSVEPGAGVALAALGLDPLLDLGLRLGEASGALAAVPLVQAAAALLGQMATFDEAAVSGKD